MAEQGEHQTEPFPEPRSGLRVQREWTAAAWSGPQSALERIEGTATDVLRSAYQSLAATNLSPDRQRALGKRLVVYANVKDRSGSITRIGNVAGALAQMDASDVAEVLIGTQADGERDFGPFLTLHFRRNPTTGSAVKLLIRGADEQWVAGAYDRLVDQVSRNVPRWAFMRHWLVAVLLGALLGAALALVARLVDDDLQPAAALILGVPLGGMLGGIFLGAGFASLFPGFEVLGPDNRSSGRRVAAFSVAAASFLLGVAGLLVGILAL